MIKVPAALQKKYHMLLMNSEISQDQYIHCKKWLRFYLDFCKKYAHSYTDKKSLLFFRKIEDKEPDTIPTNASRKGCGIILFRDR